ncbi:proline--tRNA ligase [Christensenellaceae bacterium OttesenSCG-928-K19]|nr:proline--tRNA ligase [Christensenellaceae bacterium OttesenSCG-928-K19]
MAKQKEGFVEHITPQSEDFSRWYTDVIKMTDMVDYSEVKGAMVIKAYGYGIWELMQREMDDRFKATGHKNAYFPLLIPKHLLEKEAEHVEGFAPEVAWVTKGGEEELAEPLAIRPTSETIFCSMYAKWVQSYRDLPVLLNQWCNVLRWEKSTRPFLRTSEFLWQEGHTVHATQEEAEEETKRMLGVYVDFAENVLAIPVISGRKSEKEKFAGAVHTYTMEALMLDGKALQMGTSHNLGQNFAKGFDIQFLDRDNQLKYVWQTSWGSSTRMIGGLIMVHGDERGLKLPPKVAPTQCVIVPVAAHKPGVLEKAQELFDQLKAAGIRVDLDDRDQSPGWKFNEWELKGVPVRIEIGPRDIEAGVCMAFRRDTFEKESKPLDGIADTVKGLLEEIQRNMLEKARAFREEHTFEASDWDAFMDHIENGKGFVKAMWCGDEQCELEIKEQTGVTTRCMPFEQEQISDVCVHCGKPATKMMYFARAY